MNLFKQQNKMTKWIKQGVNRPIPTIDKEEKKTN